MTSRPSAGHVIPFLDPGLPLSFGRGPGCTARFDLRSVSRVHARAIWIGDQHFITDAGSTHGTLVNGRIADTPVALKPGDQIRLGPEVKMTFAIFDSDEEASLIKADTGGERDPITGLFPGSHLQRVLDAEMRHARSCSAALSVITVRLCEFQSILSSLGRAAADQVIAGLCCLASSWVRGSDTLGRLQDDLLMIITPGAKLLDAVRVAERLCRDIKAMSFSWESQPLDIHVGIGVASLDCCEPGADADSLVGLAVQRGDFAGQTRTGVNLSTHAGHWP